MPGGCPALLYAQPPGVPVENAAEDRAADGAGDEGGEPVHGGERLGRARVLQEQGAAGAAELPHHGRCVQPVPDAIPDHDPDPSLRAAEETLRRWLNAAALVRPGGSVVVLAEASLPAVQALVRWDPVGFAERELAERAELGFPPAVRMAAVTGPSTAVAEFVGSAALPDRAEILGPIPAEIQGPAGPNGAEPVPEPAERALIRIPRTDGLALARALHAAQAARSARKDGAPVRVQLDPAEVA